jgi:hypothetical protein
MAREIARKIDTVETACAELNRLETRLRRNLEERVEMWKQQAEQVAIIKAAIAPGRFEEWWKAAYADGRVSISYGHAYALDRLHFVRRRVPRGLEFATVRGLPVGSVRQLLGAVFASGVRNVSSNAETDRYPHEPAVSARDPDLTCHVGGTATIMREHVPSESIHTIVASPPYLGQRDIEIAGQIGREANVEDYIARILEVGDEAKRVLKSEGVMFLDLGDAYGQSGGTTDELVGHERMSRMVRPVREHRYGRPKDLLLLPARAARALQARGWFLRAEIVWRLAQPKLESVDDRRPAPIMSSICSPSRRLTSGMATLCASRRRALRLRPSSAEVCSSAKGRAPRAAGKDATCCPFRSSAATRRLKFEAIRHRFRSS